MSQMEGLQPLIDSLLHEAKRCGRPLEELLREAVSYLCLQRESIEGKDSIIDGGNKLRDLSMKVINQQSSDIDHLQHRITVLIAETDRARAECERLEALEAREAVRDVMTAELIERAVRQCRLDSFTCKARAANGLGSDSQDCDWPFCGCDVKANDVLAQLQECGLEISKREVTP